MSEPQPFEIAFDELFRRSYLVARRILGDTSNAEDVAAETLARTYAHWRKVGDQPWREGWVVRVTTNLALDLIRKQKRLVATPLEDTGADDDDVAVRLALAAAMSKLPRRQREVVALRYLSGLSEAETAAALQVSTGSVKTHLHRGLASLRTTLGDTGELIEAGDHV